MQLQNRSLTFIHKNKPLLSASSIVSPQLKLVAHNTTASLQKLNGTDYVGWEKRTSKMMLTKIVFRSKSDSNYLKVKLKVFKKGDNIVFQLVQNVTIGDADFNHFMR